MEIQKATGIVLSSKVYGESDIIADILTREYGKRKFIFKGLKKSKRRSQTGSEPGSVISLVYYYKESKNYFIVNEFEVPKHNFDIRKDLDKIYHLYFLLETVEKTVGYNDSDPFLFDLLTAAVKTLAAAEFLINLSVFFIIHLLRFHGILPEFTSCKVCGSGDFGSFSLDISDLSPTCSGCHRSSNRMLHPHARSFILLSLSQKFPKIDHSFFDEKTNLDLLFHLILFIEHYFSIEIKSKGFILNPTPPAP
ncbi:MAG: DNA repair protein RecO [bacterium]|nr:DNA repair protein RecO [bacterium]